MKRTSNKCDCSHLVEQRAAAPEPTEGASQSSRYNRDKEKITTKYDDRKPPRIKKRSRTRLAKVAPANDPTSEDAEVKRMRSELIKSQLDDIVSQAKMIKYVKSSDEGLDVVVNNIESKVAAIKSLVEEGC